MAGHGICSDNHIWEETTKELYTIVAETISEADAYCRRKLKSAK